MIMIIMAAASIISAAPIVVLVYGGVTGGGTSINSDKTLGDLIINSGGIIQILTN